jgi:O-antigen ligase
MNKGTTSPRWAELAELSRQRPLEVKQIVVLSLATLGCYTVFIVLSLPPWKALGGLLASAALAGVFAYPFAALYALFCVFFLPMELGELTLAQICGAVTLLSIFLSHTSRRRTLAGGSFFMPLFCYAVIILLSTFYARHSEPVWLGLYRFSVNTLLYLMTLPLVDSSKRLRWLVGSWIAIGTLNGVYGVYVTFASNQSLERAAGFVGNANHLGFLCAFAVPLCFHRFLRAHRVLARLAYLGLIALMIMAVMASASRGATVSLLAGLAVCAFQARRRLPALVPLAALILVLLPFAPRVFFERVSNLSEDVRDSVAVSQPRELTSRGYLHKAGLKVWKDYPILGVGVGNFGRYFASTDYNPGFRRGKEVPQHNVYLRVLVETGLIGAAVFGWLLWILAARLIEIQRRAPGLDPDLRATAEGLVASMVIWAVMGLSMDFLFTHELYILLALVHLTHRFTRGEAQSIPLNPAASSS